MPSHDAAVECQNLGFQCQQLRPKSSHAGPGYLWQPSVVGIDDDFEQLIDTFTPNRCDDPELSKMGTNGIDDGGLLANEQMARAMKRQAALLFWGLGRHEPHIGSRDSFTNRFRIGGIILLSLDIRFHISGRHQAHGVAKRLKFA